MGYSSDLDYLARSLKSSGCLVLQSTSNEGIKSLNGLNDSANRLADEIISFKSNNNDIKRISFVGNSLGGLFTRYVIKLLYDIADNSIAGLEANKFLTIASPHLGVRQYTFIDDYGINGYLSSFDSFFAKVFKKDSNKLTDDLKLLVSNLFQATGNELFLSDNNNITSTLLYEMATSNDYLKPLQSFYKRRLYANLQNDFMVPLGTAAILPDDTVKKFRTSYSNNKGIVRIFSSLHSDNTCGSNSDHLNEMINSLNNIGWEKVIVSFPGFIPMAHNKIAAVEKFPNTLDKLLGFPEGQFVMDNASEWLTGDE
eukprot:gene17317-22858_t